MMDQLMQELYGFAAKCADVFEFMHESAPDGFWFLDTEQPENVWLSPAFVRILGYDEHEKEVLIKKWLEIIHPQDLQSIRDTLQNPREADSFETTIRYKKKSGGELKLDCKALILIDEENRKTRVLAGHRINNETRLRESEAPFKSLFEFAADAIFIADKDSGIILNANQTAETLLKRTREQIIGLHHSQLHAPEMKDKSDEFFESARAELKHSAITKPYESIVECADGARVYVDFVATKVSYEGKPCLMGTFRNVHERKMVELQLAENYEIFDKLTSQMPGVVYQFRVFPDGRMHFPFLSRGVVDIFGFTPEEVKENAKLAFDLVHPDDIEQVYAAIFKSAEELTHFYCEFRVALPERGLQWRMCDAIPERLDDGSTLWYGITTDITEQKQAEAAIKENERKFRILFDNNPFPMWVYDLGTLNFLEVNDVAISKYGYSREEFLKMSLRDIRPTEDVEKLLDNTRNDKDDHSFTGEWRHKRKNGEVFLVEIISHTLNFKNRKAKLVLANDITERKWAEKKLHYQQQLISDMGKAAKVGGWEFDAETGEGSWTEETAHIHDINPEEETNAKLGISFFKPEHRPKIEQAIKETIKHGKPYKLELELVSAKGIEKWVETIGKPVRENGKVVKVRGSIQDITERKKAEKALEESEKKLKDSYDLMSYVIEHNSSSVAIHDKNLNYIYVSQRYLDDFNVKEEEIIGKHHYEVFPDIPQKWKVVHQKALQGEVLSNDEDLFERADGTVYWTKWECRPWYKSDGEIGGIIIYGEVITERKLAELELKKLSTAVEQTPASVIITDLDGRIEYVNPAFTELTGYTPEEAIGQNPNILKSGEQSQEFYKNLWNTITSGKVWRGEIHNKKKNGELYWETARISPVTDNDGNITNYLAVKEDITDRKLSEEKILESELYHRSLLQTIPDMVFVLDRNGTFLDFKSSNEEKLFLKSDDFINKNIDEIMPSDVVKKQKAATEKCLSEEELVTFEYSLEFKSEIRHFSASTVAFGDYRVIVTVRDITDLQNNLDQIKHLLAIEEKQNKRLRNFTHIVSHNLRSHTANLQGILAVLEMEEPEIYENDYVGMIKESSLYLNETIEHLNQVLDLTLDGTEEKSSVIISDVVRKAVNSLSTLASNTGVDIINDVDENLTVNAVPAYMDSIVLNMLVNGIKFSSPEVDSFVKVSASVNKNHTILRFEDNGLGIDLKRHKDKLFGMYKTFHENKDSKGLGLFMTKNQIEAMGGYIEVGSEVNRGTIFTIYLPNE